MRVISVSDEGEFGLIEHVVSRLSRGRHVLIGPGDDSAVLTAPDGRVVASTDLLVEGRHFRREWSSGYDVGRKAAAANLADVAAMGARPTGLLVGFAAPPDLPTGWATQLVDGLRDECELVGASVIGGDVVAADVVTLGVTALGSLDGRAPVARSGAQVGDAVVVAGRLGYAAAGLALLEAGHLDHPLAAAHRRPEVEYDAAIALAEAGATSMIDVSDGLLADLRHVAVASRVRIALISRDLAVPAELADAADLLGVDAFDWITTGGDDHAFVATVASDAVVELPQIGRVSSVARDDEPGVRFIGREPSGGAGHEHFRRQ